MKKILVTLFILLILIVGLPYFFGIQVEKEYNRLIEQSSKIANLVIKRENYETETFKQQTWHDTCRTSCGNCDP